MVKNASIHLLVHRRPSSVGLRVSPQEYHLKCCHLDPTISYDFQDVVIQPSRGRPTQRSNACLLKIYNFNSCPTWIVHPLQKLYNILRKIKY